jgi:hypothetical protein
MRFESILLQNGNNTGIEVPPEVIAASAEASAHRSP